jgi:hypothetical protein
MGIGHEGAQIRHEVLTISDDDSERVAQLRYVIGEETEAIIGGTTAKVTARWQGIELVIESRLAMNGQEVRLADYWSLSADGTTLTMEHRDDILAGQICIFERAASDDIDEPSFPA